MNFPDNRYCVPCIYDALLKKGHDATGYAAPLASDSAATPAFSRPCLTVQVPGSKSITNRAMLLSILADGPSLLKGALFSDDSRHFLQCVSDMGFPVQADEEACTIAITGFGGQIPENGASLYVGSAGTAARFLTALLGVIPGTYHMDASAQMRKRPMAPLLASLQELGAQVTFHEKEGFFPFTISGHGFQTRELTVDINQSSQFLSALLIAAACSEEEVTIHTTGSHGMAYIEITRRMMEQFGVNTKHLAASHWVSEPADAATPPSLDSGADTPTYIIPGGQAYQAQEYQIEPDVSAACYFYAMAPLLGIDMIVKDVHLTSMQGDIRFLHFLEQMGCRLTDTAEGILLQGPADGRYQGITADMSACSDQAITMAALAPFAQGATTITGIGHIRFQESDRITAIATELTRMGIRCEETPDSITIWPGTPAPAAVETYDDHRMAMGFSLIGLRAPGITINDPGCCRKTFEGYFQVLDDVVAQLTQ